MEHVVNADMLHEVQMQQEVGKGALYRGHGRENGVVETIYLVEDWQSFCEHVL